MANQGQPSLFFSSFGEMNQETPQQIEIIYSSADGYSQLYRCNKDGKFRILKALKPQFRGNPIYERLLKKEYEIGYELDHPNICRVYSYAEFENIGNAIEMEYVDGSTLCDTLRFGNLDKEGRKRVLCQICDALTYIHNKQIVHRDLKPQNILITHSGQSVKLIDFGLSDSGWHNVFKEKAGTREYAAPELLSKGEEVESRADIYSLGKIMEAFGPSYKRAALKATRRVPSERYSSAEELKSAILKGKGVNYTTIVMGILLALIVVILLYILIERDTESVTTVVDQIFKGVEQKIFESQK